MSRSTPTFALSVLLFLTFFAIFTSAAPTNVTCGGLESSPGKVEDVPPKVDDPTSSTNTTVVDDGTGDDSDVVNLDDINTLATTHSGTATWFYVGLGACGLTNKDSDLIVALAQPDWAGGSHCGKKIKITNPKNKRVKTATVRDLCPGCPSGNLDMSPGLFTALADDLGLGVFKMTWQYA